MRWQDREARVLRAIIDAEDRGDDPHEAARAAVDVPPIEFFTCIDRLAAAGFIDAAVQRNGSGEIYVAHVGRALPKALEAMGAWPTESDRLADKRLRRLLFMRRLYEMTDGNTLSNVPWDDVSKPFGWSTSDTSDIVHYLAAEGLLETEYGAQVTITHAGVVEVEEALLDPLRQTEHFPAITNIEQNFYGPVTGSMIQTGSPGAHQEAQVSISESDRGALRAVVEELRRVVHQHPDSAVREVANAHGGLIEAELGMATPDPTVLRESVRSLRSIAEGMVASGAWVGLVALLEKLPGWL